MSELSLKEILELLNVDRKELADKLGVSIHTVNSWGSGKRNIPDSTIKLIHNLAQSTNTKVVHQSNTGVPYYDIDFTASFLEIENNQTIKPDSYISHPFFKGCDYVVRASGQSMAKVIAHGDAIGLIKIENWQDFFPLGEIYAIVTNNGFRMIKVITKGQSDETYTLISKPTDGKKEEFPPQQINKDQILSIFKVQASSHLF